MGAAAALALLPMPIRGTAADEVGRCGNHGLRMIQLRPEKHEVRQQDRCRSRRKH
jgi:hypothetical protein